jgi:hypothetical protein
LAIVAPGNAPSLIFADTSPGFPSTIRLARYNAPGTLLVDGVNASGIVVSGSADHAVVSYWNGMGTSGFGVLVLDATGAVVKSMTVQSSALAAAAGPRGFVVATPDAATRYGFDGAVQGTTPMPAGFWPTAAAASATEYLILSGGGGSALSAARVDTSGKLEDPTPIAIGTSMAYGTAAAASTNTGWEITWASQSTNLDPTVVQAVHLGSDGKPSALLTLGTGLSAATGVTSGPSGQSMLVWAGTTSDVLGVRVDSQGAALDAQPIVLSTTAREESFPSVAHGQNGYLAAWSSEGHGVVAQRFDAAGAPSNAPPIVIPATDLPSSVKVASLGDEYLVSWRGLKSLAYSGVRVDANGAVRDTTPLSLAGTPIAAGGGRFLTVDYEPRLALLDATGAQVVAPFTLEPGNAFDTVAAAWNGAAFVVTWVDTIIGLNVPNQYAVRSALMAPDTTLTAVQTLATRPDMPTLQATALGGGRALVGWFTPSKREELQVLDAAGQPTGAIVSAGTAIDTAPSLVSDAAGRALLAWQTLTNVGAVGTPPYALSPGRAMSIDFAAATPAASDPFPISHDAYAFGSSLASDGASGVTLVVRASTADQQRTARVAWQTVSVPIGTPAIPCDLDGGTCDGGVPVGAPAPSDAGLLDAGPADAPSGTDITSGAANTTSSGCACATSRPAAPGATGAMLLFGSVLLARRRTRARRGLPR